MIPTVSTSILISLCAMISHQPRNSHSKPGADSLTNAAPQSSTGPFRMAFAEELRHNIRYDQEGVLVKFFGGPYPFDFTNWTSLSAAVKTSCSNALEELKKLAEKGGPKDENVKPEASMYPHLVRHLPPTLMTTVGLFFVA